MRQFAHKGFRIEQLSLEAKILYSGFLLFSMAALLVSVLYYYDLVGDRPFDGAREYYAGEVASSSDAADDTPLDAAATGQGPALVLPEEVQEEPEASPMLLSMTRRKLLEVTHFHLFTLPIFLLVIAHLFMLCPMPSRLRVGAVLSGVLSSGAHMAAPWLIMAYGGSWSWLMPITGTWMTLSMMLLMIWPAWSMWRPTRKS